LLGSAANVQVVAAILAEHAEIPVVLDPVLASGRGDVLATEETIAALRELIVPQSTVATPNSIEARRLANASSLAQSAQRLVEPGAEVVNTLYDRGGVVREDRWPRLAGSYHGSGCTLASAIAAALANGLGVPEAVRDAQEFTWQTLASAFRTGTGQLIPDRFFWARETLAGK